MANETTVQTSYVQENHEADECRENVPPGVSLAAENSKQMVQAGEVARCPSTQQSGENLPLFDTCTFSTPAPTNGKGGVKKLRLSGLQSALTPILKYLNIGNKCTSPETSKEVKSDSQKSNEGSKRHPNSDISVSFSGQSLGVSNPPVGMLQDECLPEITLLDVTYNSTMQVTLNDSALPDSVPATPVAARPALSSFTGLHACKLNASTNLNTTIQTPSSKMDDPPESAFAPLRWLDDRYFPEITLLDVTRDSELSPGVEISSMNFTQDISPPGDELTNKMASSELSEHIASETGTMEMIQGGELSSTLDGNVTHTVSSFSEKCEAQNTTKPSLESTRDISMSSVSENSQPCLEPADQIMENIPMLADDTHPVNVTHDISSSSDMSAHSAASNLSTSDLQSNTSSKTVTAEPHGDSVVNSSAGQLQTSHDVQLSSTSPKTATSANDTFTVAQSANLSSSSSLCDMTRMPQNMSLDLPLSNVNSPKAEIDAKDLATSASRSSTENSLVTNSSGVKANGTFEVQNGTFEVQNATFDRNCLHKSSSNSMLGGNAVDSAGAGTFFIQNSSFDTKAPPQTNGTITLSETSASDVHQNTMDKQSSLKVCNVTSSPKNITEEVQLCKPSEDNSSTGSTNSNAKMAHTPESTFEADPPVENIPEAVKSETEDPSQLDGISDTPAHQSRHLERNKANTFNLDDMLDLAAGALITSTPVPTCKMFTFHYERELGDRVSGATKNLYRDGPAKPEGQVTSEIPSNIVCDRKTFLKNPAAKSLLPPMKTASHLLKYKPASAIPGRFEPSASGLPMTRRRTQAEALKSTAASDAPPVAPGPSSSYNLRATTTASKQPTTGLQKPQSSSISSRIQRTAAGLRLPSAKSNLPTSAPSGTDKLRAPTAANPGLKGSQSKKHSLTRVEALQVAAKRRKIDAPLPLSNAEAQVPPCDAANKAKNLKPPTAGQKALPAKTQREDPAAPACTAETSTSCDAVSRGNRGLRPPVTSHRALLAKPQVYGCSKCAALEEQLKMKSEEIRRLKEELYKDCKEEEEC